MNAGMGGYLSIAENGTSSTPRLYREFSPRPRSGDSMINKMQDDPLGLTPDQRAESALHEACEGFMGRIQANYARNLAMFSGMDPAQRVEIRDQAGGYVYSGTAGALLEVAF